MPDPRDLSEDFNTPLAPDEEQAYQSWATEVGKAGDVYDYDLRGAWKSGATQSANGHLPDTYKKPNHPTFSTESQYNGAAGFVGGQWQGDDKSGYSFVTGPANLHWRSAQDLADYFKEREPNVSLRFGSK